MRFTIGLLCVLVGNLVFSLHVGCARERPRCVLFYYHHESLPAEVLKVYDWVVLDADNPHLATLRQTLPRGRQPRFLAYISVGEIEPYRGYFTALKPYALCKNPTWGSYVADLRCPEYLDFLLSTIIPEIVRRGFDGFLLDTLDSYELCVPEEEWQAFEKAEISFIQELRVRYPEKLIVINRGFAIVSEVAPYIDGFLCEGLYRGLDARKRYVAIPEEERRALLVRLQNVQRWGIPVIVIDYVPPRSKKLAKEVVQKIAAHDFIPYVADKELSTVGFSLCRE